MNKPNIPALGFTCLFLMLGFASCGRATSPEILPAQIQLAEGEKLYEGFILTGFEWQLFLHKLDDDRARFYWVAYDGVPEQTIKDLNAKGVSVGPEINWNPSRAIWVRAVGTEESGGGYGHMGQYKQQLTIKRVLDYSSQPVEAAVEEIKKRSIQSSGI